MLVLKLPIGSTLKIGPATIHIFARKGNWITFGIDCPKFFAISRLSPEESFEAYPHLNRARTKA